MLQQVSDATSAPDLDYARADVVDADARLRHVRDLRAGRVRVHVNKNGVHKFASRNRFKEAT